jgi:single-strand DNA-binding protein
MANSNNVAMIVGNMGADPEVKTSQAGLAYCNFSVATQRYAGKENDKPVYKTTWHNVTLFGHNAEYIGRVGQKGAVVSVVGEYVSDENQGKVYFKILGDSVNVLARGKELTSGTPTTTSSAPAKTATASAIDEDIPF